MLDLTTPFPETVAAVDLGSNSFHLIVARTAGGEPTVVDRLREMVQLAAGLDDSKHIEPEARERALDCLRRFGQRLQAVPPSCVRAVGTNTLRRARNACEFLAEAEGALGHRIETISGIEEARLIYLGVAHSLANPSSRRLVVDVGGGSTELIIGESFKPVHMESLYVGCVSVNRTWFGDGELSPARWRRAELAVLQELEPVCGGFRNLGWEEAVGSSGTARSADAVIQANGWSKKGITPRALRRVRDELLEAGSVDRARLPGLSGERRSVFAGGVVVLLATLESLGVEQMRYSDGALREGLLYDLLGRIREEDVRGRSVTSLGDRYHVDWKQAGRVECTALQFLGQVADGWQLASKEARQLLSWACQLHEIGLDIAHAQYHKHGEYVIAASDLPGFSREEQKLLATLVRAHRRKFPAHAIRAQSRGTAREVERLAIILRLAVLLHRGRSSDLRLEPQLVANRKVIKLRFPQGWLESHPLTRADLEQESAFLKDAGYRLDLE